MSMSIRKGAQVWVMTGKDSGRTGRVLEVKRDERGRAMKILVEHVNVVHRHRRQTSARGQGGITQQEAFIDASNVMLVDPTSGTGTRIGAQTDDKGQKTRVAKKSNSPV